MSLPYMLGIHKLGSVDNLTILYVSVEVETEDGSNGRLPSFSNDDHDPRSYETEVNLHY